MNSIKEQLNQIIKNLQAQHETYSLEFKEARISLPASFWETYSSFANTSGGYILLGIREKPQEICGVENPDRLLKDLCNTANNKSLVNHNLLENQNMQVHKIADKYIISVYIPELPENKKPLYLKGNPLNAYIRINEGDYKITDSDLKRFIRNTHPALDSDLLDDYILDDLDMNSVLSFKNLLHVRYPSRNYLTMDNLDFLQSIGAYQIDRKDCRRLKMTVACLLFFGKYNAIRQKFPHFHLEYLNHRNCQEHERWSDRVCTGDLEYPELNVFSFFQLLREKLRATINDKFELDQNSERKSSGELKEALREALANMLIHADYFDGETDIKVTVEDLYYTFTNPGKMLITENQFFIGGVSNPRNTTLITFFRVMGMSDRAGTGGMTLLNFAKMNKFRAPEIETNLARTALKLWIAAPLESHPEFDDKEQLIYEFLHKNRHGSSVSDLEQYTKLTKYQIRKILGQFMDKKIVTKTGRAKATRYHCTPSIIERADIADKVRNSLMHQLK